MTSTRAPAASEASPIVIGAAPLPGAEFVDLPARVRAHARARPEAVALVAGATELSWEAVSTAMDAIAARLTERGVGRGATVASVAGVTIDHLLLYLGTLAAGGCMAPLPASAHPGTVRSMLDNCAPRAIFVDTAGRTASAGIESLDLDGFAERAGDATAGPAQSLGEDDLFDIIYSSGTTGAPKGIVHDHRFRNRQYVRLSAFGYDETATSLVSTPLHSNTTLSALLPALSGGGRIVLMARFDAGAFLDLVERHGVTHAMLVPVQYQRILAHPGFDGADLSSFRAKFSTSAPFPPALMRQVLDRWPGRMLNIYGMTEGGVGCTLDATAHPDKLDTIGRPVAGADLRVLGPDSTALPPGGTGEVVGRSATMMLGYRGDPERTRDALWKSPEGTYFVRSGDVGSIDADGFVRLVGRSKDMINSGGFNVFPADLETVLTDHPDVEDAAVVAIPSPEWGETPMAFVVARHPLDPEELRAWANARLGRTQRIARLELRQSLPRSDIGKVLKRELRAPYWEAEAGTG